MVAKVCRYRRAKGKLDVVVYLQADPDECPHDWDWYYTPQEWKEMSGLRLPKVDETMIVDITFHETGQK